jgi:hypothetical protein
MRNAYKIWSGNFKGRDHLGNRDRWEHNTGMDITEVGCRLDSTGSGKDPVVDFLKLQLP